jgi:hypothetical protein
MRGTLVSLTPDEPFAFARTAPNFSVIAAFAFENLAPDGRFAKTAPIFSDMAIFAFEKVSPEGLFEKTAANFAEAVE